MLADELNFNFPLRSPDHDEPQGGAFSGIAGDHKEGNQTIEFNVSFSKEILATGTGGLDVIDDGFLNYPRDADGAPDDSEEYNFDSDRKRVGKTASLINSIEKTTEMLNSFMGDSRGKNTKAAELAYKMSAKGQKRRQNSSHVERHRVNGGNGLNASINFSNIINQMNESYVSNGVNQQRLPFGGFTLADHNEHDAVDLSAAAPVIGQSHIPLNEEPSGLILADYQGGSFAFDPSNDVNHLSRQHIDKRLVSQYQPVAKDMECKRSAIERLYCNTSPDFSDQQRVAGGPNSRTNVKFLKLSIKDDGPKSKQVRRFEQIESTKTAGH